MEVAVLKSERFGVGVGLRTVRLMVVSGKGREQNAKVDGRREVPRDLATEGLATHMLNVMHV